MTGSRDNDLHASRYRRLFADLPRRAKLTLQYEGVGGFASKSARFLVRLTPFHRLLTDSSLRKAHLSASRWYSNHWRPVTVIVAAYGDVGPTIRTVKSLRRTTTPQRVRIIVVDDGSSPEQQAELERRVEAEVVLGEASLGYAANVNRVLEPLAHSADTDVVLLNNDILPHKGWLESLQYTAYQMPMNGIVGAKLLYPDGSIQFAGSYRNLTATDWFDHRFRFKPGDHGPANIAGPVLAVTGACMYVKAETLSKVGALDGGYPMAFEDIDFCLRAWENGYRCFYQPAASLSHVESKTRGTVQGERELASKDRFWGRWGDWFDQRPVLTRERSLRIVYVTQGCGIGGGHRVVFEHLNQLAARGHEARLYTLEGPPDWHDLRVPVEVFADYERLTEALSELDAIKVATWWETAEPVWLASVRRGIPVYFVQDIETSYYPYDKRTRDAVLATYRPEFRYLTTSPWNRDQLADTGFSSTIVAPGVDHSTYRALELERRNDVLIAVGRSHYLKNLELTIAGWQGLPEPRPELWLFGVEPDVNPDKGSRYFNRPTDAEVNELLNQATAFVQTSRHEGFCLPVLEAMSAGTPVVCTDADGNAEFCRDGQNCLMPTHTPADVTAKLRAVLSDSALRERLEMGGLATAAQLDWQRAGDELDAFYRTIVGRAAALSAH